MRLCSSINRLTTSEEHAVSVSTVALKMEEAGFSEVLVPIYQTTYSVMSHNTTITHCFSAFHLRQCLFLSEKFLTTVHNFLGSKDAIFNYFYHQRSSNYDHTLSNTFWATIHHI